MILAFMFLLLFLFCPKRVNHFPGACSAAEVPRLGGKEFLDFGKKIN
jgi:hypothetical protein